MDVGACYHPPSLDGLSASFGGTGPPSLTVLASQLRGTGSASTQMITERASASRPAHFVARLAAAMAACALLAACATRDVARPVVVQGAMDVEIRKLAAAIEN